MKYFIYSLFIILLSNTSFSQNKFTINDIYGSLKFRENSIKDLHWAKDGTNIIYRFETKYGLKRDLLKFDFLSGKKQIFIKSSDINLHHEHTNFSQQNMIWSPNEKYILFTGKIPARKTKSGGDFFLFDIINKRIQPVHNSESQKILAQFSPDSKFIGYVKENNLYISSLEDLHEIQLTYDGANHVLNGYFDWVYEEEFDINTGWQWSLNSKYIAFWQLDVNAVPVFQIPVYNTLYPNIFNQRYPKAGQNNSKVRIGVVNIETRKRTWFQFDNEDFYIPRIQWLPCGEELAIIKFCRLQIHLEIYLADIKSGNLKKVYDETDERWIEICDNWKFLNNSIQFVWTSEATGYQHIYLNNYINSESKQITKGEWQIRKIVGVDEVNNNIYFTANKESELENHLYKIDFEGINLIKLSNESGWHDVSFSPDCKYYLDKYSNINTPTNSIILDNEGTQIAVLIENDLEELDKYEFEQPEFLKIPVEENVKLNAWMLKPPDFDSGKKYPLMIYTYGGPGSQKVRNKWGVIRNWYRLLSQNGIIVACVDNRGTEGRGADFKKYVYKKLGQLDVNDQILAVKYLRALDFIDSDRIGIYGWSYGGYMSLMCLMQGSEVFKLAVSVAPVTDWRFYDTIYTESYMQTPNLNKEGYDKGSVFNYANLLKGKLLLIHGMADDNVHFQNSVELVDELIRQNKQFDTMFYPGYKHGIRGKREHVFTKITDFILENL